VAGSGGANDRAMASFMVSTPMITLTPSTGPNGALVSVSGMGFEPGIAVTFSISSGGLVSSASPCASSVTQSFTGCTFSVTGTPATNYVITAEGSDVATVPADAASSPFTITALMTPAGGVLFAKLPLPIGVAANSTRLLATEFNDCTTIFSISSTGVVSTFATAPNLDPACEEAYPAISPGFAFFTKGEVFLTQGPDIFEVGPKGGTMTLFAAVPGYGENPDEPTGITFDTVGTFGFNLLVSGGPSGTIETISYTGTQTVVGTVGYPVEGPAVAPLSFGEYGGYVLVGTGASGTMVAVSPGGVVSTVANWPGAGSVAIVPTTSSTCTYDGTDPYFVADESAGAVYAFGASQFSSLTGDALVTSDSSLTPSGIAQVMPSGSTSSFSGSKDLLPGSLFIFCPVWGLQASIPAGLDPYEMAYDPVNHLMYSSDHGSDLVYLFNSASTVVATLKVGMYPTGIVYDPANNEMMVANSGSNSVTFINARTNIVLGSVAVGHDPQGLAYDLYNFEVYVANEGSNSLSLISPFNHVVATVSTGPEPFGVAFDPLPFFFGLIYTSNMGGTVTIISGLARVATLTLPCAAANIAEDFTNGEMYVDDYGCSEVTLILGTKIVTSVGVGLDPFGVAFDPKTGFMYVSNTGSGTLTVLNGTKIAVTVFLGSVPYGAGVTYDPANALVYIAGGDPRPSSGGDT
jgi:YVTN family beta-propeller protein